MDERASESGKDQPERTARPVAITVAIIGGVLRLVPHPWNFNPAGALEVFAGARLRLWQALSLALIVRLTTDLVLQPIYSGHLEKPALYLTFLPFVYVSIVLNVMLGCLLRRTSSPWWICSVYEWTFSITSGSAGSARTMRPSRCGA